MPKINFDKLFTHIYPNDEVLMYLMLVIVFTILLLRQDKITDALICSTCQQIFFSFIFMDGESLLIDHFGICLLLVNLTSSSMILIIRFMCQQSINSYITYV